LLNDRLVCIILIALTPRDSSRHDNVSSHLTNEQAFSVPAQSDEVFARLLTTHRNQIFRLIFCMVHSLQDTEDVFQQATLTMWDRFSDFQPGTDFAAWAAQIARHKALNFLAARGRQRLCFSQEFVEELAQIEESSNDYQEARLRALASCREKLSPVDQQLLTHCYGGAGSIREAAKQIGRPVGSVYDSLSRIRHALSGCIQRKLRSGGQA
jgi:RNA polymerase sigma-70 factor (ECF subfamily)